MSGPSDEAGPGILVRRARGASRSSVTVWGAVPRVGSGYALALDPASRDGDAPGPPASGGSPPAGELQPTRRGWGATLDPLGFRQFYGRDEEGWSAVSTDAAALALAPSGVDLGSVAVAAHLGWLVGQSTLFAGVRVLPYGATLTADGIAEGPAPGWTEGGAGCPVQRAARMLRESLTAFLDRRPDAELQLTGGLDSRLLLAAIPPGRRRGLAAMTLRTTPAEVAIADALARRYGLDHTWREQETITATPPEEAFAVARRTARRLLGGADPLAAAAVELAEGDRSDRPRLIGLGGEVARGFYYAGPPRWQHIDPGRIRRLAAWRLFANESVPTGMLDPAFASWAQGEAMRRVTAAMLVRRHDDWFRLTDDFYLRQRTRRWAGTLASAFCFERRGFNPMLEPAFVALVSSLPPAEKRNSRFLARVLEALDPELARLPLEGRPAPTTYAHPTAADRARIMAGTVGKVRRKVVQRMIRAPRPPVGGAALSQLVVDEFRAQPGLIEGLLPLGILNGSWLDRVMDGRESAAPSATGLLLSLVAVTESLR